MHDWFMIKQHITAIVQKTEQAQEDGFVGGRAGYRQACEAAKERLELLALNHSSNEDTFRQDLLNIAKTTLRFDTSSQKSF